MATIFKKTKKYHNEIYKNLQITEKRHDELFDAWCDANQQKDTWMETFKALEKNIKPTSAEWLLIGFWSGRKYEILDGLFNNTKIEVKVGRKGFLAKLFGL